MKILVVGSGGREHAICRALLTGEPRPQLIVAPGNPGTASLAENVAVAADGVAGLVELARAREVDLVIPGPEAPLVLGLADSLRAAGIPCCGPSAGAARLEASKRFTRELGASIDLPQPRFEVVTTPAQLAQVVAEWPGLPVVKADGLAAGKGVYLPESKEACVAAGEALLGGSLGEAGRTVVLEERLSGTEASLFYACHGADVVALPHARDHKRLQDADRGPNTGGMGAVSPNPVITPAIERQVRSRIVEPTLAALAAAETPFVGFLFVGIMLTSRGPELLEFNVRLGDPETQAILPRLAGGELLRLCDATARGALEGFSLRTEASATCAIVLAASGYPDDPRKGDRIEIAREADRPGRWLLHAGTRIEHGALVTAGGRVLTMVASAADLPAARRLAYDGIHYIRFHGMHFRKDIGD